MKQALLLYKGALAVLVGVMFPGSVVDYKSVRELTAVCSGNISAARVIPGPGQNLDIAKDEARGAITASFLYVKGYFRPSKAYELVGDINGAMDVITNALKKEELQANISLAKRLILLQTDGKGLPTSRKSFDN